MEEVERLCDRVAFIHKGSIIKTDTVAKLLEAVRDSNAVEVVCESIQIDKQNLLYKMGMQFPAFTCTLKNENTIKVTSPGKFDITPVVNFLAMEAPESC